ncbi:isomerizing glutamine--fructose-6-phosphate transaminase [Candidatus Woesebacteria bacterium]|nr:isomerizing glutamine--fructose-6-phosphate transaminase [Candidatus Woesebacteria bacterium]
MVVQNGVVENYQELKAELLAEGYQFVSETDTEVIVGLLEQQRGTHADLSLADVQSVFQRLAGRNTIGILTRSGEVFAIRDGSPLVVGRDEAGAVYLSSDIASLADDAEMAQILEHGQGVHLLDQELIFFDAQTGDTFSPHFIPIDTDSLIISKEGYDHFMLKEMHEQSAVLQNVVDHPVADLQKLVSAVRKARKVYTIGAGSASFAAGQMAYFLRLAGVDAHVVPSYAADSYVDLANSSDLAVVFSQSGETADTNEAVEHFQDQGVQIASIVNMPGSTLTHLSDFPFMLKVGTEVAVASTKALTGQMCWGWLIAELAKTDPQLPTFATVYADCKQAVGRYQAQLREWWHNTAVQSTLQHLSEQLRDHDKMFVLGRGQLFSSALENALKMKEISYIHAEGFNAGELKHGVIALIESGTPVMCLVANDTEKANMLSAAAEVKARGALVIGIAPEENELFDTWIPVPINDDFISISAILPAQMLTYHIALAAGQNPDKPRNLAKSVTVK